MTEQIQNAAPQEQQDKLNLGDQVMNFLTGPYFLLHIILAIPWTIQLWTVQAQRAKAKGERWFPQLPKTIMFYDRGYTAQDALKQYHVHYLSFGSSMEIVNGQKELVQSILVPASQFDYADAILHQHGVSIIGKEGSKRRYAMRPPRDYSERNPQRRQPRRAKLGKTYR